jgi:MFS family permease
VHILLQIDLIYCFQGILKAQLKSAISLTDAEYQNLAGFIFTIPYTFSGIPIGAVADLTSNRKVLLGTFLILWSGATLYGGFANNYSQMSYSRALMGFAEAGCTPFAASILSDYFGPETRGSAFGVYNMGIYTGTPSPCTVH